MNNPLTVSQQADAWTKFTDVGSDYFKATCSGIFFYASLIALGFNPKTQQPGPSASQTSWAQLYVGSGAFPDITKVSSAVLENTNGILSRLTTSQKIMDAFANTAQAAPKADDLNVFILSTIPD